ncbi:MAG: hypothetical protein LBG71_03490 [Clostridiales Family XIII bacterium]|jgi:hypothetical protein|nr:hypothetical protein [Clostridiales Family XIII bacterium]
MKKQKSEIHTYFNKAGTKYLKDNGIDPHGIKRETLGKNTHVSERNTYVGVNGDIRLRKNDSGNWTPAYENIGR